VHPAVAKSVAIFAKAKIRATFGNRWCWSL